jgi:uncharacterized membrane protein
MLTRRSFRVSRKNVFSCFCVGGCLCTMTMETRKRNDGNVVVFMALMILCHFLLFGMN